MNSATKNALFGFILPAVAIIIAGGINIWLGIAAFIIYIAVLIYFFRALIYSILGSRKYSLGLTDEALKWFKRAHDTKRAGVRISVSYAYILLKNAEPVKSEEILQQILNSNPNSQDVPYIRSILALVLWKKGELDPAIDMLQEVIQVYKTTSVYGSLGYLLILKGDAEEALQFNLEAYDYNSSDKIIQDNLGQCYYLLGQYDKAREIFEALLDKAPAFPEPYYNYGLVLLELGEPEKALENMKTALSRKFSYLSSVTAKEIEAKIKELSV